MMSFETLRRYPFVYLALFLFPAAAYAQADQSQNFTPPLAIYHGSEIDHISQPMGSLNVSVPLLHLKGRGLDLDLNATYNTLTWSTTEIDDPSGLIIFETDSVSQGWG